MMYLRKHRGYSRDSSGALSMVGSCVGDIQTQPGHHAPGEIDVPCGRSVYNELSGCNHDKPLRVSSLQTGLIGDVPGCLQSAKEDGRESSRN